MEEIDQVAPAASTQAPTEASAAALGAVGDASTGQAVGGAVSGEAGDAQGAIEPAPVIESASNSTAAQGVMAEIETRLHHLELLPSVTAQWFREKLAELKKHL